jgi:menaquinone-specific isochorismate synthase
MADPKERYEHQLVIEDLKSQLSGIGDVAIGSTEAVELPTLYHLKTRIQARPRGKLTFEDFVTLLHPTPALGVSPRAFGFQEMLRWDDSHVRRRFGAPFGASFATSEGQRDHCIVAIRNIQWESNRVQLGSGCGVVPESDPQREWSELSLKRESVKRMLSI